MFRTEGSEPLGQFYMRCKKFQLYRNLFLKPILIILVAIYANLRASVKTYLDAEEAMLDARATYEEVRVTSRFTCLFK